MILHHAVHADHAPLGGTLGSRPQSGTDVTVFCMTGGDVARNLHVANSLAIFPSAKLSVFPEIDTARSRLKELGKLPAQERIKRFVEFPHKGGRMPAVLKDEPQNQKPIG